MQIIITSTLTQEQALILAKEKGYLENIDTITDTTTNPMTYMVLPNPQSAGDFLKKVYEQMIIEDSTRHFIEYDNRLTQSIRMANELAIKNSVIASISSSVV